MQISGPSGHKNSKKYRVLIAKIFQGSIDVGFKVRLPAWLMNVKNNTNIFFELKIGNCNKLGSEFLMNLDLDLMFFCLYELD